VCAFPKCTNKIFGKDKYYGKVCHIEAANETGKRWNPNLPPNDRREYPNLILMCGYHHDIIDADEQTYTVEYLRNLKANHESRIEQLFTYEEARLEDDFLAKYDLQMEVELQVREFKNVEVEFGERSGNAYLPSLSMVRNNLLYFTEAEISIIDELTQRIQQTTIHCCFMLLGRPSSGKSSLAIFLAEKIKRSGFDVFYLNISHRFEREVVLKELDILGNEPTVLIIDDIHTNLPFAKELYQASESYPQLRFLFLSRIIDRDLRIDLEGFSLYDVLASSSFTMESDHQGTFRQKVAEIVELRRRFNELRGKLLEVGDVSVVARNCLKSLFRLHMMLRLWEQRDDNPLDEINDESLKDDVYRRYLQRLEPIDLEKVSQYATLGWLEIDFIALADQSSIDSLRKDGLLLGDPASGLSFVHSQFAELLLGALIAKREALFEYRWKRDFDKFMASMISDYVESFDRPENEVRWPRNATNIIENIGIHRRGLLVSLRERALKLLLANSRLATVTLFLRIVAQKKLAENALQLLSLPQWIETFRKQTIITIGNSLTEIRRIDPDLAGKISAGLDVSLLSMKMVGRSFDHQSKFLSELRQIDPLKAREIYDMLNEDPMVLEVTKSDPRQIGIGLSRLLAINSKKTRRIYERTDDNRLAESFKSIRPNDLGRVLDELSKVCREKTDRLLTSIGESKDFVDMLSESRSLNEIHTLIHSLHSLERGVVSAIVSQLSSEKIQELILRSHIVHISDFLSEPSVVKSGLAGTLADRLTDEFFIEKLTQPSTSLSQIGKALIRLCGVDRRRFSDLFAGIPNLMFITKATQRDMSFREIAVTLSELRAVNRKKTISVYKDLQEQHVFVRKAIELDVAAFLDTLSILNKFDSTGTAYLLEEYLRGYDKRFQSTKFSFQAFSRAMNSYSKVDKEFAERVLGKFKQQLFASMMLCHFNQLTAGLSDLHKAFPETANSLLAQIPIDQLAMKAKHASDARLSVGLGEIKKIDSRAHTQLLKSLNRSRCTEGDMTDKNKMHAPR
jgi:hypothetical protein